MREPKKNIIPIVEDRVAGSQVMHPLRRLSQYSTLLILILIPMTGLFRIDPVDGAFVILGYQVWFSDIFLVMGFWIFFASLLVLMYSLVGAVFCGWACPQNTVSEWANALTKKLLGRQANMMDMSGKQMRIASRRASWLNYVVLSLAILAVSMVYALIPLLYFYPPDVILSFILFQSDDRLAGSLHWIYFVCVVIMVLDIAVIRHLMCKYMCIYRVWQHSFKTRDTLHIAYDASRSDHCLNCSYCVDHCFLDIDPKQSEVFDSCVNCGECIVACDELHAKSKKMAGPGLLRFALGDAQKERYRGAIGTFFGRAKTVTLFTLFGLMLFVIGIVNYSPASYSVYRSEAWQGDSIVEYRVNLANKLYRPVVMSIEVQGLADDYYTLDTREVHFDSTGRQDVALHLNPEMPKGIHRFQVLVTTESGWSGSFAVAHYANGGKHDR
ncbi:MAG: 4Fe-4S binding protein [Zetaproteobacteria bacterium]|nr:4Fe-4S binding protein [Zetaproteobacteria bacterium]